MITPQHYQTIKELTAQKIDELLCALEAMKEEAENCPEPAVLTQATAANIIEGSIIWYVTDDELQTCWVIVEEVLNPSDEFKAFCADDGCRYGLDGAYIEVMQQ